MRRRFWQLPRNAPPGATGGVRARRTPAAARGARLAFGVSLAASVALAEPGAVASFKERVEPMLQNYCYDCHGDGMDKGQVAFDAFKTAEELVGNHDLWFRVLKNVRAGIMPPAKKRRPSAQEIEALARWIKFEAFGLDPANPDPGRVTVRRLNRVEYRNTIRDLMGIDFRTDEEFPPDDTGYGFDNIGDVLTVSPLLLEKYLQAAEAIVERAVPKEAWRIAETTLPGRRFRAAEGGGNGERLSFYKEAAVSQTFTARHTGTYRVSVDLEIDGAFDFDPGRCRVVFKIGDHELLREDYAWEDRKKLHYEFEQPLSAGDSPLTFTLQPLTPPEQKKTSVDLLLTAVRIEGPLEKEFWQRPWNFDRFFTRDAPESPRARRQYARQVLERFATRAFRRPVEGRILDRLVEIAGDAWREPGKSFEAGVGRAMVAVLASPRFLFRVEQPAPGQERERFALLDEYSLASRLSYFLWSTMPDEELFGLAQRGELRANLAAQVRRLVEDPRANEMIANFVGQWLQARDVEGTSINERAVLRREEDPNPAEGGEQRRPFFRRPRAELTRELRLAMRRETEMFFEHIVRENRSVLELIDSDYTFLNEELARHYGIPGVEGREMRRVPLPADSVRGGILTQGTMLVVTSNPTRTSPVKRGLFILDNLLGTPPPPPPATVPDLEESEKEFKDREPTLKEVLELHRSKPLCKSCHARMDPLGLALENFNAMGMWREKERGQPIEPAGQLITGEQFHSVRDLKRLLANEHRLDFYRCLTEKLLTYALGRGLEYYDVHTVDQIVARLEAEEGRFSALLMGVIESAPFQRRRNAPTVTARTPPASSPTTLQAKRTP